MAFDERISVRMVLVDKTSATLQKISKELNRTQTSFQKIEAAAKQATAAQKGTQKAIEQTSFSVRELIASVGALTLAYQGLRVAQAAIQSSDQLVTSTARLSIVSDDPNDMLQQVYQMSQEVRSDFMEMSGTVAKMGINVGVGEGEWFSNTDQLIRFNELLAKTFKTGGQNNKEIAAGMLQLTQAMSSGRLQGDEFRSMFENAPLYISYIGEYMAKVDEHTDEFGNIVAYTAGELKQLAAESKITTDIMINAMMDGADKIEAQFDKLPVTIEDRWTQTINMIKNQAKTLFKTMNDAVNTEAFVMFLNQLSDQLTVILGIVADVMKILSPAINLALATWKLWTPFAALLGAALAFVITKLTLIELGVTKAKIATKLAAVEAEHLALAHKAGGEAASFYKIQVMALNDILGRHNITVLSSILKCRSRMQADRLATTVMQSETLALIANTTAMKLNNFVQNHARLGKLISVPASALHINMLNGETLATSLLTIATTGLNFAMAYLTIPMMIVVGVAWTVIKVFNKLHGTSYSLTGVLMGVVNVAVTALTNGLIDLYNAGVAVWNLFTGSNKAYKDRFTYTEAWNQGLNYGNIGAMDYTATGNELAQIKGDTSKIVDNTQVSADEMEFLRRLAEDRVGFRTSNVNVNIVNNNDMKVSSDYDIDGIVDKITVGLEEAINNGASGVHI